MKHTVLSNYYVGLYTAGIYGTLDSLLYTTFFQSDSSSPCEIIDVFVREATITPQTES
jgi:hypothetical protein